MGTETKLNITASDGYRLSGTQYVPDGDERGVVLIVSAMGVAQRFYTPVARWLAAQGWRVITFDYRGMGESRNGSLRDLKIDLQGWARLDCDAALGTAAAAAHGKPLVWLGHSLGGQLPAFTPGMHRVSRVITIASGSGYWRDNAWALKRRVWLLWFLIGPLATLWLGYFPGRRLGMVGDLPAGVIRQWRRWCLHPNYAIGVEGNRVAQQFAEMPVPVSGFAFSDDELMSARNIEWLHDAYRGTRVALRHLKPSEMGLQRIGHFGFFRPEHAATLWPTLLAPVLAQHA